MATPFPRPPPASATALFSYLILAGCIRLKDRELWGQFLDMFPDLDHAICTVDMCNHGTWAAPSALALAVVATAASHLL